MSGQLNPTSSTTTCWPHCTNSGAWPPERWKRYVQLRGQGVDPSSRAPRSKMIDDYLPKVEELVERSQGRIGAGRVHDRLVALGFDGTDRTTRRAVAAAKAWVCFAVQVATVDNVFAAFPEYHSRVRARGRRRIR